MVKKILFINKGDGLDYQCDCLYHGLCCLDDVYIETLCDYWYMYEGNSDEALQSLYGKGFTIAGRISKSKQHVVAEPDALQKIKTHAYTYIIYGSIHREKKFLSEVLACYKRNEIAVVDGEDLLFTLPKSPVKMFSFLCHFRFIKRNFVLARKVMYFKRELDTTCAQSFYPISFSIPAENIVASVSAQKIREQAVIYPGDKRTYIYNTESEYYRGYQESKFGMTFKKAGWDCMRHYEILANGCIPYFPNIKKLPSSTMVPFPRHIIIETNRLRDAGLMTDSLYAHYANMLLRYTREYLTTKKLAEYVLSVLGQTEAV